MTYAATLRPYDDMLVTLRGPKLWNLDNPPFGNTFEPQSGRRARWSLRAAFLSGLALWLIAFGLLGAVLVSFGAASDGRWWHPLAILAGAAGLCTVGVRYAEPIGNACGLIWPFVKWAAIATAAALVLFGFISPAMSAELGKASVYGDNYHGRKTASGRTFSQGELTAAHKTLPFGTKVRVTNLSNGLNVVVTITDRGPFVRGRVIDLSRAGQKAIGMPFGLQSVRLDVLGREG